MENKYFLGIFCLSHFPLDFNTMRIYTTIAFCCQLASSSNVVSLDGMGFDMFRMGDGSLAIRAIGEDRSPDSEGFVKVSFDAAPVEGRDGFTSLTVNVFDSIGGQIIPLTVSRPPRSREHGTLFLMDGRNNANNISSIFISRSPRSTPDSPMLQMLINPRDDEVIANEYCREGPVLRAPMNLTDDFMRFRAQASLVETEVVSITSQLQFQAQFLNRSIVIYILEIVSQSLRTSHLHSNTTPSRIL